MRRAAEVSSPFFPFYWLFIPSIMLGLFISLLLHGGIRGLYFDDYIFKRHVLDLVTGAWKPRLLVEGGLDPYLRPLAKAIIANLAIAIPDAEAPLRVLWALIHLTNAALVGLLIYRVLRSHLAAALSILLFLVPVPAHESLLWHTGAGASGLGATEFLAAIHFLLTAIQRERRWIAAACVGFIGLLMVLATYEQYAIGIVILPLFGIFVLWNRAQSRKRKMLVRACLLTAIGIAIALVYWSLILSKAWSIGVRGGLDLDVHNILTRRARQVFGGVRFLTLGEWGLGGMWKQAFLLGIQQVFHDPISLLALGLLVFILVGLAASSTRLIAGDQTSLSETRPLAGLFVIGTLLSLLAFVPALVIRNQIVESRMMYFAWIGFTLAMTALLEYMVRALTRRAWWPGRVVILSVGSVYLAGVLTLTGFAHVYRLRAEHDQRQIAALVKAVPSLPTVSKVMLLPIDLDERSVRFSTGKDNPLDTYLFGVFEHSWSAAPAMQMAYKYPEIEAITSNRWGHLRFTGARYSSKGTVNQIVVNGQLVETNRLLAFTYEDDKVVLLNPLILVNSNAAEVGIPLPLVERVRTFSTEVRRISLQLEPIAHALN